MKQIKEDIKNHSFHSVYLLYGEERYLVSLYRDKLKDAVLAGSDEINFSGFQGSGVDLAELKSIADTLPFFHDYRLVLLEDTRLFKAANDLADYLKVMPETTVLVFAEKEVDKRNKLYKYVAKNGVAAEMKAMSTGDIKKFIALRLHENGRKVRESTVQYFLERVDTSMLNVINELEKLIAYSFGREEVTPQDIDAVCCVQVTGELFKMLDAVAAGRQTEAIELYHDLLELKESPMSILYMLTRHFNILLQVKTAGRDLSKGEIAKKVGVPPFAVGKYQAQCRSFSEEQLKRMLTECVDTEFDFKRGRLKDQIGVELLLVGFLAYGS